MQDVPGIRADRVAAFFRAQVPGGDTELTFELISGGRSNLTYLVRGGDRTWVLRRPPLGHVLPTAHDMAREYRVLSALAGTNVPAPRAIALCEDTAVNEAVFYVMEHRPGVVLHDGLPAGYATDGPSRRRMASALVDTLVRLHAVDWRAVGLEGFGKPDGYLERQVRRWAMQWEGNKTAELPAVDTLLRRLASAVPASPAPTIVHGDYRLGNMALDPADPGRIVAVFDWEMATIGDPLADLGYTLMYWPEPGDPVPSGIPPITNQPGFPLRATLIEEYARRSGRDVDHVDFYLVLAFTKLAVIAEGIFKRFQLGKDAGTSGDFSLRAAAPLAERALAIADAASDPRLRG
ncbi:MAG TPA: phosphotransferase family protein [Candidatus Binatia bacterium]|nr:phosphotransferase family protein [Candidatus Binatia bacterium]